MSVRYPGTERENTSLVLTGNSVHYVGEISDTFCERGIT